MSFDLAVIQLQAEIDALGIPKPEETNWWLLRAKSTGMSLLKAIQANDLQQDPIQSENFRKAARADLVAPLPVVAIGAGGNEAQPLPGAVGVAVAPQAP